MAIIKFLLSMLMTAISWLFLGLILLVELVHLLQHPMPPLVVLWIVGTSLQVSSKSSPLLPMSKLH